MTKRKNQSRAPSAGALFRPFEGGAFKWPDDRTSYSGVVTSKQILTVNPAMFNGGPTTTHNWGVLIYPSMDVPAFQLYHDASGTLQDVNVTGTGYNQAFFPANRSAVRASPGLLRCTGIGARIVYEGTELQRAGRYIAGTMRASSTPVVVPGTGTRLSPLSSLVSTGNWFSQPGDLEQEMLYVTSGRVSDGVFDCVWRPSKVPQYMSLPVQEPFPTNFTTAAGVSPGIGESTMLSSPIGLAGMEAEQAALVLLIEGDQTPVASATGNTYKLEIVWHWEHVPQNPLKTVITLTPSPYDPQALAAILNRLHTMPTGTGTSYASMDTAQPYVSSGSNATQKAIQWVGDNKALKRAAARALDAALQGVAAAAVRRTPARRRITQGVTS